MARRDVPSGRIDVSGLVIKKEVRFKFPQKLAFGQAAQKHGLINLNVPVHQGANSTLVSGGTAGGDQRRTNTHGGSARLLQPL